MSETARPPERFVRLMEQYPDLAAAYRSLGEASTNAGPLDERMTRLVRLGIAIGMQHEGAVHAHTRKALAAGWTADEVRHAALAAVTTLGWPSTMAAYSWVEDVIRQGVDADSSTDED
jgi:4-carboxymuconolactone decarboxylase